MYAGTAVTRNLLASNYQVTSIYDIDPTRVQDYPCKVAKTPREIAEENDITITGTENNGSFL